MSVIKSFSVGCGDMFYIKHGTSNFTIIDCCLSNENRDSIVGEIISEKYGKDFTRFISTHPDEDHIQQLDYLDNKIDILNFYCVKNHAIKSEITSSFERYCKLRDSTKAFYLHKGCRRKWMNQSGEDKNGNQIGSAGINILWPNTDNEYFKNELENANNGIAFNNISCIMRYAVKNGPSAIWFGDMCSDFMNLIVDDVALPKTNLLFAPHHGRKSGKLPNKWINMIEPDLIIMGEVNSNDSDYASYPDYNKIRQNSARDITFECVGSKIHCYSSNPDYIANFLDQEDVSSLYIGTLNI